MLDVKNYIKGQWCDAISGKKMTRTNPADTTQVVGTMPDSSVEDAKKAIEAAHAAFDSWKRLPAPSRAKYIIKAIEIIKGRIDKIAHDLSLEQGKPLREALREVNRGIEEMEFFVGEARRIEGRHIPSAQENTICYTIREPIGVITCITPWNYPFIPSIRKIVPALIFGNTAVLKPANITPFTSAHITEAFDKAGIPAGVLNFIVGRGSAIGDELVVHPWVKGITFTGSNDIGSRISQGAAKHNARLQLEMGGKNAAVVTPTADMETAAAEIVARGTSCSGQLCVSISRVIVHESVAEKLYRLMKVRMEALVVGHGLDEKSTMGPMVTREHMENVLSYIQKGIRQGAKLITGGQRLTGEKYDKGNFISPAIFTDVAPDSIIAQEEIFGPVLSVITYRDFAHALEINNSVKYGLAACIYTQNLNEAMTFAAEAQAGMVQVNLPTYADAHAPFGGMKASGFGPHEVGYTCVDFCTDQKTVYIKK